MAALPTTKLSALLPLILPHARECPEPYALQCARLAAIEFCERTRCWRHVTSVAMTENHTAVVAPQYSTIHEFEEVTFDGNQLTPTQFTDAEPEEMLGIASADAPRWVTQIAPGEIAVYPFRAGTLRIAAFLKPRHGQLFGTDPTDPLFDAYDVIPEFLFIQHASALAAGALMNIMVTPDEPFTNFKLATAYAAKFNGACDASFSSSMRGQQRARLRTKQEWF